MADVSKYSGDLKKAIDAIKKLGDAETADKTKKQRLKDADTFQKGLGSLAGDQKTLNDFIKESKQFDKDKKTYLTKQGQQLTQATYLSNIKVSSDPKGRPWNALQTLLSIFGPASALDE